MDHERRWFIALSGVLMGFGVLMVHSASITSRPTEFEQIYLSRHLLYLLFGTVAAAVAAQLRADTWKRLAPWLYLLTLALLVAVLVPGIGTRVKGAQRWLRFGGYSLQPSELAKITLPLCLCLLIEKYRTQLRSWVTGFLLFPLPALVLVPLVLLEPDLGTSMFLVGGVAVALWLGGWPLRNFVVSAAAVVPAVIAVVLHKPYMLQRITGFVTTWTDPGQAPYQVQQSLATLGAGGIWGVGLGRGWQKLSFLPEANTDFVFAVIGEELGLAGTLGVLLIWGGLFVCGLRLLQRLPREGFAYVVGFTLLFQLVFQALVNVAVVTALLPPKGIAHPLISYGGSNLFVSLVSLGIIVGLARPPRGEPLPQPAAAL